MQAVRRLESIERRLRHDPVKAKAYNSAINEYVEKGFAEVLPNENNEDRTVRYLPHHAFCGVRQSGKRQKNVEPGRTIFTRCITNQTFISVFSW